MSQNIIGIFWSIENLSRGLWFEYLRQLCIYSTNKGDREPPNHKKWFLQYRSCTSKFGIKHNSWCFKVYNWYNVSEIIMLYLDLRGSQHQQINAYLCYLHFLLYKSNLHINKNDFKSLTISYIYFEIFLFHISLCIF